MLTVIQLLAFGFCLYVCCYGFSCVYCIYPSTHTQTIPVFTHHPQGITTHLPLAVTRLRLSTKEWPGWVGRSLRNGRQYFYSLRLFKWSVAICCLSVIFAVTGYRLVHSSRRTSEITRFNQLFIRLQVRVMAFLFVLSNYAWRNQFVFLAATMIKRVSNLCNLISCRKQLIFELFAVGPLSGKIS